MYGEMKLRNLLESEVVRIEKLLPGLEKRLCALPKGALYRRGKYLYRIYYEDGKQRQLMIPDGFEERELLIKELQERRYLSRAIPMLKRNLKTYRSCLKKSRIYDPQELKKTLPSVYGSYDCSRICLAGDIDPRKWAAEKYECNTSYRENLIFRSEGGLLTRSKAEANIATKLEQYHQIFRYDEVIYVGARKMSPDFSILHSKERRIKYWEHFGLMDDPAYAARAMDKLCNYASNGIRMGDNLIVTWESRRNPLSFERINACIREYLL